MPGLKLKLDNSLLANTWGWIVLKAEEWSKNNKCATWAFKVFKS